MTVREDVIKSELSNPPERRREEAQKPIARTRVRRMIWNYLSEIC